MEARHKNMLIGALLAVVLFMAIGYAAFSTSLQINGTADITSKWEVKITDIKVKNVNGNPHGTASNPSTFPADYDDSSLRGTSNPTYTDTTATFYSELVSPGDYITYDVTITNAGTLPAKLSSVTWDATSLSTYNVSPIIYSYEAPNVNSVIAANNGTAHVYVTVTYDSNVTQQPAAADLEKSATLILNFVQG